MAHRLLPKVWPIFLAAGWLLVNVALSANAQTQAVPTKPSKTEVERRFEIAFAPSAPEHDRPLRFFILSKSLVISAGEITAVGENRVKLSPCSIARFSDSETCSRVVRGKSAVFALDRAYTKIDDLATVKAIEVTISENVTTSFDLQEPASFPSVPPSKPSTEPRPEAPRRFFFKIDEQAPIAVLLPTPPKAVAQIPLWTNEDMAKVPELSVGEPISKGLTKNQAMEATAHLFAKVNYLNRKKADGFILALMDQRPDLRGLPFLMGAQCRTHQEQAKIFAVMADECNQIVNALKKQDVIEQAGPELTLDGFGHQTLIMLRGLPHISREKVDRAAVAAVTQIVMPESEHWRAGMARYLAAIPHVDATKALARVALFSPEASIRTAAIDGLKTRRERDYGDILLQGFRYPLPAVSKRAADALVKLERKDLLPELVAVLERPDPRLPVIEKRDGKEVTFVRELVKVNHHRNCVLCHAPGNTENVPEGVLKVAVPLPNEPLPKPAEGGYQSTPPISPDIVVRLDMTYLRQDFSLMMPVRDAHPWPEMQRFDFLVRTRQLTPTEAQAYEPCCEMEEPGRLSPYHRAALYALRELTGLDTQPTAAAWRKLLMR